MYPALGLAAPWKRAVTVSFCLLTTGRDFCLLLILSSLFASLPYLVRMSTDSGNTRVAENLY